MTSAFERLTFAEVSRNGFGYGSVLAAIERLILMRTSALPNQYRANFEGITRALWDLGEVLSGEIPAPMVSTIGVMPPGWDPATSSYFPGLQPGDGSFWFDSRQGRLFVCENGQWYQTNGGEAYVKIGSSEPSRRLPGTLWYNTSTGGMLVFLDAAATGGQEGWYPFGGGGGSGTKWLQGEGSPGSGIGALGDFYLDVSTGDIYGPKGPAGWGSAVFNIAEGPPGAPGDPGADGREIELQTSATHIQWRYAGDTSWINLVALSTITGPTGAAGTNGREIELQTSATHIQWRYAGDTSWINLVALSTITGPAGAAGANGREIQLQTSATHIQWRYAGDTSWINLVALSTITGPQGAQGIAGAAATVAVGTVTTGAAGSSASVSNSGTPGAAVFNFSIPRGDTGATGAPGSPGSAATVTVGTVTTGAAGSSAVVANAGTSSNAVLDFTIPRGEPGAAGGLPRSNTAGATSGTLIPNGDTTDLFVAEGLTGSIALASPSGTPVNGQKLLIKLKDDGVARSVTWTTSTGGYRAVGTTLPTTTVLSKTTYIGCVYNSTDLFWDAIATVTQA